MCGSDYRRPAGRYEELFGQDEPPPDVLDRLEAISSSLRYTPVAESDWAEARPSASNALAGTSPSEDDGVLFTLGLPVA